MQRWSISYPISNALDLRSKILAEKEIKFSYVLSEKDKDWLINIEREILRESEKTSAINDAVKRSRQNAMSYEVRPIKLIEYCG